MTLIPIALLGNPMFLVKARMQVDSAFQTTSLLHPDHTQAYSPVLPVGTQRRYYSAINALQSIYSEEGVKGLFRGVRAAMFRTSLGTSVQMPTFFFVKSQLIENNILSASNPLTVLISSAAAGAMVVGRTCTCSRKFSLLWKCLSMQPADTTLTRLWAYFCRDFWDYSLIIIRYNQPTRTLSDGRIQGVLYTGPFDCLIKTVRTEGPLALYKGNPNCHMRKSLLTPRRIICSLLTNHPSYHHSTHSKWNYYSLIYSAFSKIELSLD